MPGSVPRCSKTNSIAWWSCGPKCLASIAFKFEVGNYNEGALGVICVQDCMDEAPLLFGA